MELATHRLKRVTQVWFNQWKMKRVDHCPIDWEKFKVVFLNRFFPLELSEAIELINCDSQS